MSNDTAKTITTNIVPVQGTFEPLPPYECINLIGPAGTPFYAPVNPNLDGVSITNSTINSTTIGATTPSTAAFTTATMVNQPVGNLDLCNKTYVDSAIVGISWKQPVVAATLSSNITLSGTQSIDGVSVVAGNRVLVKNQTNQAENGIYIAAAGPWSRSADANAWDELVSALVFIESGSQAGTAWYCPVQPGGTIGVTPITWSNFSIAGTYYAGTGLSLAANTFSITNTGVSAATYGSGSQVPVVIVNAQGQITSASNTNIAIAASQITSGTIDSARIAGDYSGITGVGTLTNLTVSNTITGSISGNAATATTATSATTATTATNLAGGTTGSVPYQSGAGATTFVGIGSTGQVLTVAGGVPTWATPTTGTVTSVSGTGTVSGISLSGTVTSSGSLTLGGSLDLSSPPTIGNTTPNTIAGTTVTASTSFASPVFKATNSAGGTLQNASGTPQMQWGSGGGNNLSLEVSTNINGTNAQVDISPTGTGHVHIKPTGSGSLEIAPTNVGTINNMSIGGTTPAAAKVTTLDVTSTLALNGSTGTAGYVLTSNGASAPTWQASGGGITIADDTTTNATRYLTFTSATSGNITTENVSSTKLQFNPSTGVLTSTSFSGAATGLTGTASININGTVGATTPSTGAFTTLSATGVTTVQAGTVSAPAITTSGDTNTGIFFPAADTIAFTEGGTESMRIDSSGNVGIGNTSQSSFASTTNLALGTGSSSAALTVFTGTAQTGAVYFADGTTGADRYRGAIEYLHSNNALLFTTDAAERMRITSGGNVQLSTAATSILNSSGRAILNQTGSILQVVSTNKTDTFSTTSTTFTDITGLSVTITPSSTSSRIVVFCDTTITAGGGSGGFYGVRLMRDSTAINIGAAAGSRTRASYGSITQSDDNMTKTGAFNFVDSPATTSAVTYKLQAQVYSSGTIYINRQTTDSDSAGYGRFASTITVMEIAG